MNYVDEFRKVIEDVSAILGRSIDMSKVEIVDRGVPHQPKSLRPGTMGVYTFSYNGEFLKIGKAGPSSNPRFLYQHYKSGSAMSTLSGSLLSDSSMVELGISDENVGQWIKDNCRRVDILINTDLGILTLELIEALLHYKYEPKYEGFLTQR